MADGQEDSICVCIAAYNAEGSIARAVVSALKQSHVSEVIVVDDASQDATATAARQCDDGSGRLSVVVLERNAGPSAARNKALEISRASIFCVLDSDDYFVSDRIGRLLGANVGAWDFLADDILMGPADLLDAAPISVPEMPPALLLDLDLPTFVLSNIAVTGRPRGELGFLKPLIRRRFLDAHGLRFNPDMRLGEDYALYVGALAAGARFKTVDFSGYVAVERRNSLSALHNAADLDGIRRFDEAALESSALTDAERTALSKHLQATTNRWAVARALEIRRSDGILAGLRFLTQQPRSAPHVLSTLLQARSDRLLQRLHGTKEPQRSRYLIGRAAMWAG